MKSTLQSLTFSTVIFVFNQKNGSGENSKSQPRWKHTYKSFVSSYNQKKDNSQFKTINNQKCQKIKLHGILTTQELKKHSSRPVGGAETGSPAERTCSKAAEGAGDVGLTEHKTKDSKPLAVEYCGYFNGGRNSSFTGQFVGN